MGRDAAVSSAAPSSNSRSWSGSSRSLGGAVLPAEQLLDLVLQLLDPPVGLPNGSGLLADQLVAEGQAIGEGDIDLTRDSILSETAERVMQPVWFLGHAGT